MLLHSKRRFLGDQKAPFSSSATLIPVRIRPSSLQELQACVPAECSENIIRGVEKTPAYSTEHVWFIINDKQAFHGNTLLSLRRCFPMRVECITRRFVLKVFETGSVTI